MQKLGIRDGLLNGPSLFTYSPQGENTENSTGNVYLTIEIIIVEW